MSGIMTQEMDTESFYSLKYLKTFKSLLALYDFVLISSGPFLIFPKLFNLGVHDETE